ncbi:MAG: hypothetical protein JST40_01580 [Armatimonadetes bacterium]|nr:hypothetical protein [Armatimonadota bacterium]
MFAGIGRWWDDPRPIPIPVRLGLGSVAYIFLLTIFLALFIAPYIWAQFKLPAFLTFIAATAPPAMAYALPVERYLSPADAVQYNFYALVVVATYRVSLLIWYLLRAYRFPWWRTIIVFVVPISLILFALMATGQGRYVLEIMGGFRDKLPREQIEQTVMGLGLLGLFVSPVVLVAYAIDLVIFLRRRPKIG